MSILVKGVKMPRCCEVCPFNYDYYRCEALGDRFDDREEIDMETQRLPDCPLVEMPSRADVVEVVRCKDCKHHEERSRNMSESLKVLNEILEYSYGMLTAEKYGLQHKILSMIKEQGHDV